MVYTSHYMEEVEQICERVMIMDAGRSVAEGTPDELKRLIDLAKGSWSSSMPPANL